MVPTWGRNRRLGLSIDCHNAYRHMIRLAFPHAAIVADAFHLHRRVLDALAEVRRSATIRIARARSGRARLPKATRHALARARDDLAADTFERGARQRAAVAEVCGLDPPLALAYELEEAFRALPHRRRRRLQRRAGNLRSVVQCFEAGALRHRGQLVQVLAGRGH